MNCVICGAVVFDDQRRVGSVRQSDGSLKNYHMDCLYAEYPHETDYDSLVLRLFGDDHRCPECQGLGAADGCCNCGLNSNPGF